MIFSLNVTGFSRSGRRPCILSKFRTMTAASASGCCMAPRFNRSPSKGPGARKMRRYGDGSNVVVEEVDLFQLAPAIRVSCARCASKQRRLQRVVMPVLVTGIHVFFAAEQHVDPRDKAGGDDNGESARLS